MRIGELSARTGVSTRLLRYYEQQGLLTPAREGNTYRSYDEDDVARVTRIATLVRAGVPTRLVRQILDLDDAEAADRLAATCPRALAEELADELRELDDRITCLTRSRETLRTFLERTEHTAVLADAARARA